MTSSACVACPTHSGQSVVNSQHRGRLGIHSLARTTCNSGQAGSCRLDLSSSESAHMRVSPETHLIYPQPSGCVRSEDCGANNARRGALNEAFPRALSCMRVCCFHVFVFRRGSMTSSQASPIRMRLDSPGCRCRRDGGRPPCRYQHRKLANHPQRRYASQQIKQRQPWHYVDLAQFDADR
jgi:hypothetical protein